MINIKTALSNATEVLADLYDTARIDAEILLAYTLSKTRTYLYTHPEQPLNTEQYQRFQTLVKERQLGRPVAYLIKMREFWSLPLKVTESTLIPRPETELIVELCLRLIPEQRDIRIIDLGTGSGAIALALAKERPQWEVYACDISEQALDVAKENAASLNITNIHFFQSDWFSAIPDDMQFHAIVSNPPYIPQTDPHLQQGDLRFEPQSALASGEDGLTAIRDIMQQSIARLNRDGLLLIEHGYDQKTVVGSMLKDYGYQKLQCWKDVQGLDRVSGGRLLKVDE
ncbi:peptide chain release factor N(5)-glutamine methyltransferase [Legionella sp. 16cNR16C]|uniref:peptide chain release factor N(5)-glutamine methyltransferase n=1 Tax=Legionella sp. 16cNR16C TaxID=2905656 RepID=UPI001E369AA9|nr:peptide chain release factor N(5)-glutamine methyltransferase [Legionella sp. 16cNR16C]MCE3045837.1 peptide chain release factor N(5)-glutamine methyltransferase [Legionella sp. 16cNR16C]